MELDEGLIQVYTGNGKGKTTAAIGQGIRSAGNHLRVYMVQFLKTSDTGELHIVGKLYPDFQIFRLEKERGFFWTLSDREKLELKEDVDKEFDFCKRVLMEQRCDVLIMDEIMGVIKNGLLEAGQVVELMKNKPRNIELIMTGRDAPEEIVGAADLVTEMREIKHYFNEGITQRKGIEY